MGNNALLAAASDPTATNAISRAQNSIGGLMDYRPPAVTAPSNVMPTNVTAGQLAGTDLSPYFNPYTDDVINSALADLERARGRQQVTDNASATAAHAFGGTRQSVFNANTSNDYLRN